jgi:hypothetical protein
MIRTKRIKHLLLAICVFSCLFIVHPGVALAAEGDPCQPGKGGVLLGLPTWYEYLPGHVDKRGNCVPQLSTKTVNNQSAVDISSIWLVGLAIIEILLRIGGMVAVGYVIFGGFKYITSQGSPDATKAARNTIINAFIGLVIVMIAAVSVNFLANLLTPANNGAETSMLFLTKEARLTEETTWYIS